VELSAPISCGGLPARRCNRQQWNSPWRSTSSKPAFQRYEAAVISSGFIGFILGTTANAMANMKALVERYGPAPKAFLVVPMVGAFFIDFTNALIITAFLNYFD
jgi:hypothetical protein